MNARKFIFIILVLLLTAFSAISVSAQQRDSDGDGIADSADSCPNQAGPAGNNGCPLVGIIVPVPIQPVDTDGDGLPDTRDQCPTVPGLVDNNGCPADDITTQPTDTDGDGVPDANDGCPTVAGPAALSGCPDTTQDSDGDTIPDVSDACPTVAGLADNNGCPVGDLAAEQPFVPPTLPTEGCYVAPAGNYSVFVRTQADVNAETLGSLLPSSVYASSGYVVANNGLWFYIDSFNGYSAGEVLLSSPACDELNSSLGQDGNDLLIVNNGDGSDFLEIDPSRLPIVFDLDGEVIDPDPTDPGFDLWNIVIGDPNTDAVPVDQVSFNFTEIEWTYSPIAPLGLTFDLNGDDDNTVEYCIYIEANEAGVFEEVCFEIEIPEGCVLTTAEAGVYTIECEEESVPNPQFDIPGNFQAPTLDNDLDRIPPRNDDGTTTVEYCIYIEANEAGVFEEVCYEIEIPENCVLTTSEAGVYTVDCEGEINIPFDLPTDILSNNTENNLDRLPTNNADGTTTVEYCIYEEVHEAGVFEEVCYEIEIPENCELTTAEAGVYTVECEEEATVQINPVIGELPGMLITFPSNPNEPLLIGLLLLAVQQ